jgi:hypothetical protein
MKRNNEVRNKGLKSSFSINVGYYAVNEIPFVKPISCNAHCLLISSLPNYHVHVNGFYNDKLDLHLIHD